MNTNLTTAETLQTQLNAMTVSAYHLDTQNDVISIKIGFLNAEFCIEMHTFRSAPDSFDFETDEQLAMLTPLAEALAVATLTDADEVLELLPALLREHAPLLETASKLTDFEYGEMQKWDDLHHASRAGEFTTFAEQLHCAQDNTSFFSVFSIFVARTEKYYVMRNTMQEVRDSAEPTQIRELTAAEYPDVLELARVLEDEHGLHAGIDSLREFFAEPAAAVADIVADIWAEVERED